MYFNVFVTNFGFSKKVWKLHSPCESGILLHIGFLFIILQNLPQTKVEEYESDLIRAA